MNPISIFSPDIIHYWGLHYSHGRIENLENVKKTVSEDLTNSKLLINDLVDKKIILDFRGEGHGPHHIKWLTDYLGSIVGIDNLYVLFNSVVTETLPYRYQSLITHMVDHGNFYDTTKDEYLTVDKKFLCLNRRPSLARAQLLSKLLKTINRSYIQASFGSSGCLSTNEYQYLFDDILQLPLLIDNIPVDQYNFSNYSFKGCLFNIINESSSQHDPLIWDTVFITEKTFKAFASLQIPIWFAVPKLVSWVRQLGFDLFDDLIDHSYDLIEDQSQRMLCILKLIKNIDDRYSLEECQQIKHQLYNRLKFNRQLVEHYIKINPTTFNIAKNV